MSKLAIYVLPTQPYMPPRAVVSEVDDDFEGAIGEPVPEGVLATWSRDLGTWLGPDQLPLPEELASAITGHAKSLGVMW